MYKNLNQIKAFKKIKNRNLNVELNLVGDGPLRKEIKKVISELDLTDSVNIINNYSMKNPREVVFKYIQECDIFILPSKRAKNGDMEGTPIVLMEASSCGKPCITTKHSGNPEVVIDNKTGFVVPEGNIDEIADRLYKLIVNENLRIKLGHNARKHIVENYNEEKQKEKLIKIYNKFL